MCRGGGDSDGEEGGEGAGAAARHGCRGRPAAAGGHAADAGAAAAGHGPSARRAQVRRRRFTRCWAEMVFIVKLQNQMFCLCSFVTLEEQDTNASFY